LLRGDRRARGRTKLYVRAWALSFQAAAIVQYVSGRILNRFGLLSLL
jgi:hypothetical protein